MITKYVFHSIV